jgi:hypothetical protein
VHTWSRYWSAPGGRIAAGVVRIALAISTWIMLARVGDAPSITAPGDVAAGAYHPIGVLMIFRAPPPAIVIELAWIVAHVGALALLLGLCTRLACALTAAGALVVASQAMSYQPAWSHDLNVVLLALLAFLGARGGDALALDQVIARWRGRPRPEAAYQWSLRLIQLAVGLMFLSACMLKLKTGGVRWALSDNLRHQLLVRYDLIGETAHSPMVDWLLASAWHYKTTALLNMISQATPLLAIVFVRRPWIRALAGVCFLLEVAGLYVVMQLGNPSWFPLAAVFFDWDRIWHAVRRRRDEPAPPTVPLPRAAQWYVAAFVAFDLVISFAPGLDQRLRTFPFSRFPMFSGVRAKQPYGEHQTYEVVGGRVEPIADAPVPAAVQAEIDRDYILRSMPNELHEGALHTRCEIALASLRQRYPQLAIRGVRVLATAFQAPAYPAPAVLERHDLGVLGELIGTTWVSHDRVLPATATVFGPLPAGAPIALYRDGLPITAPAAGADGQIALPGGTAAVDVVATLPGADGVPRPFVIARRIGRNDRG